MGKVIEEYQDAITEEEINGTADVPPSYPNATPPAPPSRNAFAELMSPKRKPPPITPASPSKKPNHHQQPGLQAAASNSTHGRNALLEYINHPTRFPATRVISHSADFVAVRDLYPKSSLHLLLLPRDPKKYLQHPFDAFEDAGFLASVRVEAAKLRALAANELRRMYGEFSAADAARNAAMDAPTPTDDDDGNTDTQKTLPPGRDWALSILVGVHAHPSMAHLHVHVLSVDRVSPAMRHRKHYNSFATPFFVPLADFPLHSADPRRSPGREGYLGRELRCWRCGRGFGVRFAELKGHLEVEMEGWVRE